MRDAWRRLRAEHAELVEDVAHGRRLVWLGSGISREQVPDLVELIDRVLHFLRDRACSDVADAQQHKNALLEIFEEYLPDERERYEANPTGWEPGELEQLRDKYSRVLGVGVDGKPTDYLLVEGAGLPELYGAAKLEPGPTHLLLAMLVSEGAVTRFASGNWDGLVENALRHISGTATLLDVYVDVDDPRDAFGHAEIAKFHGCAVLALADPGRYRDKLIATTAQISKLHADPTFEHMMDHLRELTTRMRSLVLGLSMQDSDLLAIFRGSASRSPWLWDANHPAYVFAEPTILTSQRDVLEVAYDKQFAKERAEIVRRSALGAFAGPIVAAILVEVLAVKMIVTLERHRFLPATVLVELESGIRRLVLRIIAAFGRDERSMAEFMLGGYSDFVRTYVGPQAAGPARYLPLAPGTKIKLATDAAVLGLSVDVVAAALGLLGLGEQQGRWRVSLPDESRGSRIDIRRRRGASTTTVVLVRGAAEAIAMMASEDWVAGNGKMVLLQMQVGALALARSPGGRIGRGRRMPSRSELTWGELCDSVDNFDELAARFETGARL